MTKSPPPHERNLVIRASAGTGKTFQLSNRYLGLIAAGEAAETILATTFTRKAAGEILERILFRLAEAALDDAKLAELRGFLDDPNLDRARMRRLLARLVGTLHRLRVSTLDSFFLQIARSFSLELGLPPGWQVTDETTDARLRADAIRAVLQESTTGDVVRLMHLLTKGEATRSVTGQIASLVTNLYDLYQEAPVEAWQRLKRPKPLSPEELREAIARLAEVEVPQHKGFAKAWSQDLERAEREDWAALVQNGVAAKILEGADQYYRKPLDGPLLDAYRPLLDHARAVLIGQIASQTEATQGLLRRFDEAYVRLKLARRALRFDDVTRRLTDFAELASVDRVVYRLDAHLEHLLLDEFQDTAPLQWQVLRPFAQDVIARGAPGSFFCVGDVKQAIYGWRGGVAEIFDALDQQLDGLSHQPLDTSYRSGQTVIDTVNRIFLHLAENSAIQRHQEAAQRWAARFQTHQTARAELTGYCQVVAPPEAQEDQKQADTTLAFAAAEIARLAAEAPGREIGVLVRRNKTVAHLIHLLRTEHQLEASEEGGNPLTNSPAVELILSLFAVADHPGDRVARFHVASSPLAMAVGLTRHDDDRAARDVALELRRRLMYEGYGPTIRDLCGALAAACDRRDLNRLMQLVEMAYAYEDRATNRADDFVDFVRRQKREDPSSAAIRVMTVHQAKGLQFDIVVLPELDVGLTGQTPAVVWGRPGPTEAVERICRYVNEKTRRLLPEAYQRMFDDHTRRVVEESLCVLYVALTRAVHALHIIVDPSRANERSIPATMAGLLRAALTDGQPLAPETVAYVAGNEHWHRDTPGSEPARPEAATAVDAESIEIRLAPSPSKPSRGLDRRSPSQLEGGPRVELAGRLRRDAAALEWGTAIHALFEQVEWLEDWAMDDDALVSVLQRAVGDSVDPGRAVREFRRALATPAIRDVLSQATYRQLPSPGCGSAVHRDAHLTRPRWEVACERPFVVRQEGGILRGTIDRLVILFEGTRPVGADVLDFKTDAVPDAEALAARVEIYRPQLKAYCQAVARLYQLEEKQIAPRLVFVHAGQVVSL